ncbi:23S ribosomal RNA methyltransferase Erm [Gulosibacter sp. 10]|uniref:23S ribosomal RNA methyltransferase Erm n=1 Tax=Gulosibacter sp. 10 TaxID=1255570 RepID=UPI00097E8C36|nr:23S ribosomal RNA methyltransferase Erm [Gulosibacter sp. 10]SJM51857.1 23S rRNA N-6-methyltransferase ErmCX [Gulosibacter sp. 10]
MPTYSGGRHEHGQNFLTDRKTIEHLVRLVQRTNGPIIELGAGSGAITLALQRLGRPLRAIEIDETLVRELRPRLARHVELVAGDLLDHRLPDRPHVVVGNLPFHLTTAALRRVLHSRSWTDAVLLVQWEVARRRAAVGGATMMTAQWWPWVEFSLEGRVRASAFRPRPGVDGGILVMRRRERPLVGSRDRSAYRRFVHAVFTGRGRGIGAILDRVVEPRSRRAVRARLAEEGIPASALPKDLEARHWAALFEAQRRR